MTLRSASRSSSTVVDTQEEQVTWGTIFVLTHKEKRLTLALSAPVTPKQIEGIAYLVTIGLILGFVEGVFLVTAFTTGCDC